MQLLITIQVFAIFILIVFSATFSGSETALFSLSSMKLKEMGKSRGRSGRLVAKLLSQPERLLITILMGNMLVNIASSIMGENIAHYYLGEYGWIISSIIMVIVILIFGEITPKVIAIQNAERVSTAVAPFISLVFASLSPVRTVVKKVNDRLMEIIGRGQSHDVALTREDIEAAVSVGKKEGIVDELEEEMIYGVIGVAKKSVKEIMKPRGEIAAVEVSAGIDEVVAMVREGAFSRIPVYRGSLDDIQGFLYAKDLVRMGEGARGAKLADIVRPAHFVPDTKRADDLFDEFRRKRIHMAIVTDEYGRVEGLVTLEDILEEIFGEIADKRGRAR